jgi:dihydrofolate reductase
MRRIVYSVAMSLDGYIAGPNGEYDWIVMDPEIDFNEIFSRFDTLLMGRRTYEVTQGQGGTGGWPGMKVFVFSRTLRPADHPKVTIVSPESQDRIVRELREQDGKDIWLFGGGVLFRALLDAGQVDAVGVAVVPHLLGGGVPFLPPTGKQAKLKLEKSRVYQKSGIVAMDYAVDYAVAKPKPTGRRPKAAAAKGRK